MSLPNGSITEICYVTHDMARAAEQWSLIHGAGPFFRMPAPVTTMIYRGKTVERTIQAALGFSGTTLLEFIQPDAEDSIFREVLEAKGDFAMHHVMTDIRGFLPGEYEERCEHYRAQGMAPVLEFEVPNQGRNCFFDGREQTGVFIEVLETPESAMTMVAAMYAAHRGHDGTRPLRAVAELFG